MWPSSKQSEIWGGSAVKRTEHDQRFASAIHLGLVLAAGAEDVVLFSLMRSANSDAIWEPLGQDSSRLTTT